MNGINGEIRFHDDWTKNVTSRLKKTPHTWRPCFFTDRTIFELNRRIKETNVLTKFHKDWAKNVSYRLFIYFDYIHIEKTAPPPAGNVFQMFTTIFKLAKNVTSRVGHVFLPIRTIFELNRRIQQQHVLAFKHKIAS
ncbi:hypothetical protein DPMN_165731 [Dreissena polymorpha]|uniref:Uncharacterized protein n=1 Tax=Dreissena polymorpha TaxID=45954 RepID=A0A9D4F0T7_DREPO|nr:hypothetical protein DPMN_165731 [Dreissena polymorpha]